MNTQKQRRRSTFMSSTDGEEELAAFRADSLVGDLAPPHSPAAHLVAIICRLGGLSLT